MALITWADKQAMGTQPSIPDVNKIKDSDMNEIKTVINNMEPVVLYNNPSGSNGAITLSDSVTNYSFIEIYYISNDSYVGSKKIIGANCYTDLFAFQSNAIENDGFYIKLRVITINGTSITTNGTSNNFYKQINITTNGYTQQDDNFIYITKVLGYK